LHGLRAPASGLDCGNSGTTARLMMGVAAAQPFSARFDGDDSLRARPMRRVTQPLAQMGAHIRELGQQGRLPLEVEGGQLRDIEFVNEKSSAQVKSAILLAAMIGGVKARVCEPIHSRDHTERLLNAMGAELRTVVESGSLCVEIDELVALHPIDLEVPRDFSSAAFFLARGLLHPPLIRISDVGVNATRTGLLDVIRRMQGAVHVTDRRQTEQEPIATLLAEPCSLRGVHVEAVEIPHLIDEVPIIAVLAARAAGETVIQGAGELRVKETDRLRSLAANLRAVGAQAEEQGDALLIQGSDQPLRGRVRTGGDHRIAMAFGVLGSIPGNDIEIDDIACVVVSFPTFWQQLAECAR
jgi:3-phosphoshikimate 1-carboxyvinyltransferase